MKLMKPPAGSKISLRKHLEAVYKQTGRMPDELANAKKVPSATAHIWSWFLEMVTTLDRLSYQEIKAWSDLTGHELRSWELQGIRMLDAMRIKILGVDIK